MKNIYLLIALTFFLNADYVLHSNNHCVYDLVLYQDHSGHCYTDRTDNVNYCDESLTFDSFTDGYQEDNGTCVLKNDLRITGLSQNQWDYLMAVLANILGFTMLFLISFLSVLVARK